MNKALRRVVCVALSGAMVMGSAAFAFADSWQEPTTMIKGDPNQSYITVSAHRAAQTISEILGLTNTCGQNLGGDAKGFVDGLNDEGEPTSLHDGKVTPILGIFGSNLNDNPDPYYYNYFYNLYAKENNLAQSDYGIYYIPAKTGPNNADTIKNDAYNGQITSLIRRPDILIGTNAVGGVDYPAEIAELPENTDADTANDYNPVVFKYDYTTIYDIANTMDKLAAEMHTISAATGKTWRYDDPAVIANDYEKYIWGLSEYVKSELDAKGLAEKKVYIVDPAYNSVNGDGTYRVFDVDCASSVAKTCRVAESVDVACENLAEAARTAGQVFKSPIDDLEYPYVSAKDLLNADVLITCGIQSDKVIPTDQFKAELQSITGCAESDIPRIIDTQPDCIYGLHVNSSESAVGVGFFLGAIYANELDINPVYASAYFYQKLLHINNATSLQTAVTNNMQEAVQALGTGITTDLSGYSASKVEDMIIKGLNAAKANPEKYGTVYDHGKTYTLSVDLTEGIGSKATDAIKIVANGVTVNCAQFGQEPEIMNNRTMVPLRAVGEALGATVDWDAASRTVSVTKDGSVAKITIDSDVVYVDGKAQESLGAAATIKNDRTLVPVRAIAQALGCSVDWNAYSRTVIIK